MRGNNELGQLAEAPLPAGGLAVQIGFGTGKWRGIAGTGGEAHETQDFHVISVVANEGRMRETFHKGDRVWCRIHPEDIVIVRE